MFAMSIKSLAATKATVRIHVSGIEALRPTVEPYLRQLGGTEEYISLKAPELTPGNSIIQWTHTYIYIHANKHNKHCLSLTH
jgi:hypothetical protein